MTTPNDRLREARPAFIACMTCLNALYLAVEPSIGDDVRKYVLAAIEEANNAAQQQPETPALLANELNVAGIIARTRRDTLEEAAKLVRDNYSYRGPDGILEALRAASSGAK